MADIVDTTEKETKQFIVVRIGGEKFGIDIGYVDNIIRLQKITRVPKAQVWFKGIINLRGEIVPVMSARIKMGLEDDVFTNASRIINREIRKERKAGLEQGIQQGLRQGIALVAKKLKGKMEIKDISQITGLSETEIENL